MDNQPDEQMTVEKLDKLSKWVRALLKQDLVEWRLKEVDEVFALAREGLKLREEAGRFNHEAAKEADLLAQIATLTVELDSLRADKKSLISALQSCAEVVGDVSAFGSCDCDIPVGKTCVVCEAALVLKTATGALDSARKDKSA